MILDELTTLYDRNMVQLKNEVAAYEDEQLMWVAPEGVINSFGNLCLHLVGNLNHFIGHVMGKTNYVRNREAEFNDKNVPKIDLLTSIANTNEVIKQSIKNLDPKLLSENFPIEVFGKPMTYQYFLIHLLGHLEYHRGQMNYLRRMTEKS